MTVRAGKGLMLHTLNLHRINLFYVVGNSDMGPFRNELNQGAVRWV